MNGREISDILSSLWRNSPHNASTEESLSEYRRDATAFLAVNLPFANFSHQRIIDRNVTMSRSNFSGGSFYDVRFFGINMADCILDGADLRSAEFNTGCLRHAKMRNAAVAGTLFIGCDLSYADFEGVDLSLAGFDEHTVSDNPLVRQQIAYYQRTKVGAVAPNSKLTADIHAHSCWCEDVGGVRFDVSGHDLARINLAFKWLPSANLSKTKAAGAVLYGTMLARADLRGGDFRRAVARAARLDYADLRDCDLSGADLRGCNLKGAKLAGACLAGADLTGACLDDALLDGVIVDAATKTDDDRLGLCVVDAANAPGAGGPGR